MARLMSSTELAKRIKDEREFVLIDLRSPEAFQAERIPTAINIPVDQLKEQAKTFKKNQRIIVYGENHDDNSSHEASQYLESLGFRKVSDFDGGLYAWIQAGYLPDK